MVDGGEISLGIGLSTLSVAIGLLSLVIKSECEEISIGYGCIYCRKRQKRREVPPPDDTVIVAAANKV